MAKQRKKVSDTQPAAAASGSMGFTLAPAAAVTVSAASFDAFIADVDTPLGHAAESAPERRETRLYCQGRWDKRDIGAMNRVEGEKPGWGMTKF